MISTDIWFHLSAVLERFGQYFVERAKQNLLEDGSNASGTLTNSFTYDVELDNAHFAVTVSLEDYWYYVENGRKAGKMPPIDKIAEWIEVKHIVPQVRNGIEGGVHKVPTVRQLAYLIARKIGNEGTTGTHFFSKAKEDTLSYFQASIENAIREDMGEYVKNVLA